MDNPIGSYDQDAVQEAQLLSAFGRLATELAQSYMNFEMALHSGQWAAAEESRKLIPYLQAEFVRVGQELFEFAEKL